MFAAQSPLTLFLLPPQDPAGIFELVEVVGNGTYGQVYKVSSWPAHPVPLCHSSVPSPGTIQSQPMSIRRHGHSTRCLELHGVPWP